MYVSLNAAVSEIGVEKFFKIRYNRNVRFNLGNYMDILKKYWKSLTIALGVLVIIYGFFGIKNYIISRQKLEITNICQNDELIAKLITKNINPFSKFKFMKKRNMDCRVMLAENTPDAKESQPEDICSALDAATNSVVMVVDTYVKDLYDRPSASKELKTTAKLMIPYSYCPQYYQDMVILVNIKRKYGL